MRAEDRARDVRAVHHVQRLLGRYLGFGLRYAAHPGLGVAGPAVKPREVEDRARHAARAQELVLRDCARVAGVVARGVVVPVRGGEDAGAAELDPVRWGCGVDGGEVEGGEVARLALSFEGEGDQDGARGGEGAVGGQGGGVRVEFEGDGWRVGDGVAGCGCGGEGGGGGFEERD